MTTGPSPINSSTAGIPLSAMSAETTAHQPGSARSELKQHGISDTFETTDREGDGRRALESPPDPDSPERKTKTAGDSGTNLDVSG